VYDVDTPPATCVTTIVVVDVSAFTPCDNTTSGDATPLANTTGEPPSTVYDADPDANTATTCVDGQATLPSHASKAYNCVPEFDREMSEFASVNDETALGENGPSRTTSTL
jgi:hypothetical protein